MGMVFNIKLELYKNLEHMFAKLLICGTILLS